MIISITNPFLSTTGAGTSSDYEIQYYTESGSTFTSPVSGAWYPLTSERTFQMSVNRAERDRGGQQVFTLRRISDSVSTVGTTFVSVTCDTLDPSL